MYQYERKHSSFTYSFACLWQHSSGGILESDSLSFFSSNETRGRVRCALGACDFSQAIRRGVYGRAVQTRSDHFLYLTDLAHFLVARFLTFLTLSLQCIFSGTNKILTLYFDQIHFRHLWCQMIVSELCARYIIHDFAFNRASKERSTRDWNPVVIYIIVWVGRLSMYSIQPHTVFPNTRLYKGV